MKVPKFTSVIITSFLAYPISVHAEEAPEKGLSRIPWAIKCSGAMPKGMLYGFTAIAILVIVAVLFGIKNKGGRK